jgi:hypothetical protein
VVDDRTIQVASAFADLETDARRQAGFSRGRAGRATLARSIGRALPAGRPGAARPALRLTSLAARYPSPALPAFAHRCPLRHRRSATSGRCSPTAPASALAAQAAASCRLRAGQA